MISLLLVAHGLLAFAALVVSILGVRARVADQARRFGTALFTVVATQSLLGYVMYPRYVASAKPALQALSTGARSVADVFEVKEHLAFCALVLTIGAFIVSRSPDKPGALSRVLFGGAHATIVIVVVLGLVAASIKMP